VWSLGRDEIYAHYRQLQEHRHVACSPESDKNGSKER